MEADLCHIDERSSEHGYHPNHPASPDNTVVIDRSKMLLLLLLSFLGPPEKSRRHEN